MSIFCKFGVRAKNIKLTSILCRTICKQGTVEYIVFSVVRQWIFINFTFSEQERRMMFSTRSSNEKCLFYHFKVIFIDFFYLFADEQAYSGINFLPDGKYTFDSQACTRYNNKRNILVETHSHVELKSVGIHGILYHFFIHLQSYFNYSSGFIFIIKKSQ